MSFPRFVASKKKKDDTVGWNEEESIEDLKYNEIDIDGIMKLKYYYQDEKCDMEGCKEIPKNSYRGKDFCDGHLIEFAGIEKKNL